MGDRSAVWYASGLAFTCRTACGRCCRGPGGYVLVSDAEAEALAHTLGLELTEFGKRFLRRTGVGLALVDAPGGDCVLLDPDGRCRVYEVRPVQCRTFPWWPDILSSPQAWERAKRRCPGMGQGRVHALRDIRAALVLQEESESRLAEAAES